MNTVLNLSKSLSLDELTIVPAVMSNISSRSQCNVYDDNNKLPIFVSPMTSIINKDNFKVFDDAGVYPIYPRGVGGEGGWKAISLRDAIKGINLFKAGDKILIDVANGHMSVLFDVVKKIKENEPGVTIMTGNIANPFTYFECCKAGVDYVRVGIGGGSPCTTSVLTGVHYSHAAMLQTIKEIRSSDPMEVYAKYGIKEYNPFNFRSFKDWVNSNPKYKDTKVIADGGINTIDRAIKCLALGADYVMIGKLFAQCVEACGETKVDIDDCCTYRKYYGMASPQGQLDLNGEITKAAEGIESWILVDTNLKEFLYTFQSALQSAMSYTGCTNLRQFKNRVTIVEQSISEFKSYYK